MSLLCIMEKPKYLRCIVAAFRLNRHCEEGHYLHCMQHVPFTLHISQ